MEQPFWKCAIFNARFQSDPPLFSQTHLSNSRGAVNCISFTKSSSAALTKHRCKTTSENVKPTTHGRFFLRPLNCLSSQKLGQSFPHFSKFQVPPDFGPTARPPRMVPTTRWNRDQRSRCDIKLPAFITRAVRPTGNTVCVLKHIKKRRVLIS